MKATITFLFALLISSASMAQYSYATYTLASYPDISSSGTSIDLDDDAEENITVPFTIYFGTQSSTDLRIGNNGAVLFGVTSGEIDSSNGALATNYPMIAPFWDDFDSEIGGVYYTTTGVSPERQFTIQWDRVHYMSGTNTNTDPASFQLVFNEFDKNINFQYGDVDLDGTAQDDGLSATVGIATSAEVTQFSYGAADLIDNLKLVFTPTITYVPDDNFENYLETHDENGDVVSVGDATSMGNGIANDNYVTTSKIVNATELSLSNLSIADLTGIEAFMSLTRLTLINNDLTGININSNLLLEYLHLAGNDLSSLDVSNNTMLSTLYCNNNLNLSSIDISHNTNLTEFYGDHCDFSSFNTTANTALEILDISYNQISSLDVTANTNLTTLKCDDNELISLDVSANNSMTELSCTSNDMINIYLNTALIHFDCRFNDFVHLDLHILTALITAYCSSNFNLETLNVANGHNAAITTLWAQNNFDLTCIQVDDENNIPEGWLKEATASYSDDCNLDTNVPDDNFEAYLETHNLSGAVVAVGNSTSLGNGIANDNYVTTARIANVHTLDVSYQTISNLTGIEAFENLANLACHGNSLTSLDVSSNISLINLNCALNSLTDIDISGCIGLIELYCSFNNLTTLDVSHNTILQKLYANNNSITGLNVNNCTSLTNLNCSNNSLTTLKIKNGNNSNMTEMNATNNASLTCIQVDDSSNIPAAWAKDASASYSNDCSAAETAIPDNNFEAYLETHDASGSVVALDSATSMGNGILNDDAVFTARISSVTNLDVSSENIADLTGIEDFVALTYINCYGNSLTTLDMSANTALTHLYCSNNFSLTTLNISTNTALIHLDCAYTYITTLDISTNTALTHLWCSYTSITTLNISTNTALTLLQNNDNSLTVLDVSANTALTNLDCWNNSLTILDVSTNTVLTSLNCFNNSLTTLNLKNGNNSNTTTMDATGNSNLTCIQVDDETNTPPTGMTWTKDATASYSDNCSSLGYDDEVQEFSFLVYPNPVKDSFTIRTQEVIIAVKIYDYLGKQVASYSSQDSYATNEFSSGIYIVKVATKNGYGIKRIVVE